MIPNASRHRGFTLSELIVALIMLALTFSYAPIGPQSLLDSIRGLSDGIRQWRVGH